MKTLLFFAKWLSIWSHLHYFHTSLSDKNRLNSVAFGRQNELYDRLSDVILHCVVGWTFAYAHFRCDIAMALFLRRWRKIISGYISYSLIMTFPRCYTMSFCIEGLYLIKITLKSACVVKHNALSPNAGYALPSNWVVMKYKANRSVAVTVAM